MFYSNRQNARLGRQLFEVSWHGRGSNSPLCWTIARWTQPLPPGIREPSKMSPLAERLCLTEPPSACPISKTLKPHHKTVQNTFLSILEQTLSTELVQANVFPLAILEMANGKLPPCH